MQVAIRGRQQERKPALVLDVGLRQSREGASALPQQIGLRTKSERRQPPLDGLGLHDRRAGLGNVGDPIQDMVQVLDGITAAVLSVLIPLIVADVAFGSGHFNLAQGVVGTATGIGASLSTVLAGYVSDKFGSSVAFAGLATVAAVGLVVIWMAMPETRPPPQSRQT